MATVNVDEDVVLVELTPAERIAGLLGHQRIPVGAITDVSVEPGPLGSVRGLRAPGLAIPGRAKIGTWRRGGRRQMVCVRRGQQALRIDAEGLGFQRFIVGTDDADALVERIRAVMSGRR